MARDKSNFDAFISYCRKDQTEKEKVLEINTLLKQRNIKTWLDDERMTGREIDESMYVGISQSSMIIACLSKQYANSKNCRSELTYANRIGKRILCIVVETLKPDTNSEELLKRYESIGFIVHKEKLYKYTKLNSFISKILDVKKEIDFEKSKTILLTGEAGVGKSMLINSLFSYMKYKSFDDAKAGKLEVITPMSLTFVDKNFKKHEINLGYNEKVRNEKIGTQTTSVYNLKTDNYYVNIFDTPGIGDIEGSPKDKENVEGMIKCVAKYDKLDAVCILLKPNMSRLSVNMRYCFKELLLHLHRNAVPNIVFCFTNTRMTHYRPGDSFPIIEEFIEDIYKKFDIEIPFSQQNIFCFDNECFKFLACLKKGFELNQEEITEYERSWNHSVREASRLFEYIANLDTTHNVFETVKLHETRQIFMELTKMTVDLDKNIKDYEKMVSDSEEKLEKIEKKIKKIGVLNLENISVHDLVDTNSSSELIYYEKIPIDYPNLVCSNKKCSKEVSDFCGNKIKFSKNCHEKCSCLPLKKWTTRIEEVVGQPELINCKCMKGADYCNICEHHFREHKLIFYEFKEKILNQDIEKIIEKKKKQATIQNNINANTYFLKQLKTEHESIIKINSAFAFYIKYHSSIVFNDDYILYLNYSIKEEEENKQKGYDNEEILGLLVYHRKCYIDQKIIFYKSLEQRKDSYHPDINDIDRYIEKLYKLPLYGDKIKATIKNLSIYN